MPRVIQSDVREIITTDKVDLQPFIIAANLLITNVLATSGLGDPLLKEIERWMSAHFIAMAGTDSDTGQVVEEKIGDASVKYDQGDFRKNLGATRYGRQAMLLDTTGKLANLGKGRAEFRVTGPDITVRT